MILVFKNFQKIHSAVRIGIHCSPGLSSLVKKLGFVLWCEAQRGSGVDLQIACSNLPCSYSAGDFIAPEEEGISDKSIINEQPLCAFDPFISN